ncbi:hypothetical protein OHU07_30760 [Streptomyces phaeochromogenes]|uniref:hypothetical protein n=1 Tax=Streptomyces phaeochromogenes TaxID=1923 RepID=UPI002E2C4B97|nr:hypothetical protein [Streptomyces phaeochromogenes]
MVQAGASGQPFRPDHLSSLLNEVGVPAAAARGAAIPQQLLELPGLVGADALGSRTRDS